jgi:hypothetical protein
MRCGVMDRADLALFTKVQQVLYDQGPLCVRVGGSGSGSGGKYSFLPAVLDGYMDGG